MLKPKLGTQYESNIALNIEPQYWAQIEPPIEPNIEPQ